MTLQEIMSQPIPSDWLQRRVQRQAAVDALMSQKKETPFLTVRELKELDFSLPDEERFYATHLLEHCPLCNSEVRLHRKLLPPSPRALYAVLCNSFTCQHFFSENAQYFPSSNEAVTAWQLYAKLAK